jgi:PII-like signaling protein
MDAHSRVELTVYVAEPQLRDRRGRVDELMRRAAGSGLSGGTALHAWMGFGRRHDHEPTVRHAADETPLTLVFVDTAARIEQLLALLDEVLPEAVAVVRSVRAVRYLRPHRD